MSDGQINKLNDKNSNTFLFQTESHFLPGGNVSRGNVQFLAPLFILFLDISTMTVKPVKIV